MSSNFPLHPESVQFSNCAPPDIPPLSGWKNCVTMPANLVNVTKVSGTVKTGVPICSYDYRRLVDGVWTGPRYPTPCGESNGSAPVVAPKIILHLFVSYVPEPGYYDWSYEGGQGIENPIINVGYNWTFDLTTDFGPLNIAGPIYWIKIMMADAFGQYGTIEMITLDGNVVYNPPTPPGPICDDTCCEGDTREVWCDNDLGFHTEVCLCPGDCNWWDQTSCPQCLDGSQEGEICYDGSEIITRYCDHGIWYNTGAVCPVCECVEGTYRTPVTCWDGTIIYQEVCQNCGWVPSGQACPACGCVEGTYSMPITCWDGTKIFKMVCHNCLWVLSGQICPPKPAKGETRIVGTCPDGSPLYEKWNGKEWVAVPCTKLKRK